MRALRSISLALVSALILPTALSLSACNDGETIAPGQGSGPAQVDIDTSPSIQGEIDRPLWPYHLHWKLPKNIVMDRQQTKLDYTQTYMVGTHDLGYFRYTERVLTYVDGAGVELGDPIGAEIALLKSEHPGAKDFPIKKMSARIEAAGLISSEADWTSMSHVYHVHLADPAPSGNPEDEEKVSGYLLTFDMAGPPDHPWGSKGLFTRAVFATVQFAAQ